MIKFPQDFYDEQQKYVLFELPSDILENLKAGEKIKLQEDNGEIFIIGENDTFQLERIDVSNSLMPAKKTSNGKSITKKKEYKILTVTQSHLSPTRISSKTRDLYIYLKKNLIDSHIALSKPELKIDTILKIFIISKRELLLVKFAI